MKTELKRSAGWLLGAVVVAMMFMAVATVWAQETNAAAGTGVVLTGAQYVNVDNSVANLLALVPAKYQAAVVSAVTLLVLLSHLGKMVQGWRTGGVGGLLHAALCDLFKNPNASGVTAQSAEPAGDQEAKPVRPVVKPVIVAFVALGLLLGATGCSITTIAQNGDIINITSRGFGIRMTATSTTTATPEIDGGFFSQSVSIIPTGRGTNLFSPNYGMYSSVQNSANPFALFGDESWASGGDATYNGTNRVIAPEPGTGTNAVTN